MLIEDGKYYNMIKAVYKDPEVSEINATEAAEKDTEIIYDSFGRILIERKSPVLFDFLKRELARRESLICKLMGSSSESSFMRLQELRDEVTVMTGALDMFR